MLREEGWALGASQRRSMSPGRDVLVQDCLTLCDSCPLFTAKPHVWTLKTDLTLFLLSYWMISSALYCHSRGPVGGQVTEPHLWGPPVHLCRSPVTCPGPAWTGASDFPCPSHTWRGHSDKIGTFDPWGHTLGLHAPWSGGNCWGPWDQ